jgi:two-component system chemotaxis response regulator CheB
MIELDVGEKTLMHCPDCGGPLRELDPDSVRRYRCHNGHAYTAEALRAEQDESIERALWAALEALDNRGILLDKMARDAGRRGDVGGADHFQRQAATSRMHAEELRRVLLAKP